MPLILASAGGGCRCPAGTGPATSADHDYPHAPPTVRHEPDSRKVIKLCHPAGPITGSLASDAARTVRNGSFWPRLMAQPAQRPCSEYWPTTCPAGQHQWNRHSVSAATPTHRRSVAHLRWHSDGHRPPRHCARNRGGGGPRAVRAVHARPLAPSPKRRGSPQELA